jgi:hypothetical protein
MTSRKITNPPLVARWCPELEAIWSKKIEQRLGEGSRWITRLQDLEMHEAFRLAIWEIERLRGQLESKT